MTKIETPRQTAAVLRMYEAAERVWAERHQEYAEFVAEYAPTPEEREMDKARHEVIGSDDWHLEEAAA